MIICHDGRVRKPPGGHGPVVISRYGALDVIALPPGELVTIDTGHVVAYADPCSRGSGR